MFMRIYLDFFFIYINLYALKGKAIAGVLFKYV